MTIILSKQSCQDRFNYMIMYITFGYMLLFVMT